MRILERALRACVRARIAFVFIFLGRNIFLCGEIMDTTKAHTGKKGDGLALASASHQCAIADDFSLAFAMDEAIASSVLAGCLVPRAFSLSGSLSMGFLLG
jgi:hypothetical protein